MNPNHLVSTVAFAGQLLLESGAEIYRVEETMVRLANSFPICHAESFVTPTVVMISVLVDGENYSTLIRIVNRDVNLNRIELINKLSRDCVSEKKDVDMLQKDLEAIRDHKEYPLSRMLFFCGLGAFSFSFLFGGDLTTSLFAFFIGLVAKGISIGLTNIKMRGFLNSMISAGVVEILALIVFRFFTVDLDILVVSSIMLLVPGLAFTNAIRDTLAGDYLSGLSRGIEALLIAVAIAVGCGAVLGMWLRILGGV